MATEDMPECIHVWYTTECKRKKNKNGTGE